MVSNNFFSSGIGNLQCCYHRHHHILSLNFVIVIHAGNEFLCWFIAPSYARRKCFLVGLGSLPYIFPLSVPLYSIDNSLG